MIARSNTERLIEQMNHFARIAKTGNVTMEIFISCAREMIFTMAAIMKEKETEFYVPVNDNGAQFWNEGDQFFLPVYTDEELIPEEMEYVPMNPCLVFQTAYECRQEQNNPISGVIVNPGCSNVFAFESFLLDAVVCRYMGFDRFVYIDEVTGEKTVLWDNDERSSECDTTETKHVEIH